MSHEETFWIFIIEFLLSNFPEFFKSDLFLYTIQFLNHLVCKVLNPYISKFFLRFYILNN